ncbi:hypothetical protein GH714_004786 [Hevea brasiliensis]|uniref:Uncharacterized protein n=1 Tax=Hevea brasiliensis TaxID=3981 RepID=A0A6A6KXN2_HEVBR|nr:hypothetical protein GH714_004786 [Hevea brasiliensis]
MKLFEIDAYKSRAATELEQEKEVKEAEIAMQKADDYFDSVMESAMDEFRRFERMAKAELESLEQTAESARKMGKLMEKTANIASKKYIESAVNSATASMKSGWKGLSSNKVALTCVAVAAHEQ